MQVTVEIRVEPKPRSYWPIFFRHLDRWGNRPVAEDPASSAVFNGCFKECVPGKATPGSEIRSNARIVTDHRDQIARPAAAQHRDQLLEEAGGKGLSPDIQLDVGPHRNGLHFTVPVERGGILRQSTTGLLVPPEHPFSMRAQGEGSNLSLRSSHSAFIWVPEPVSLTDMSGRKYRTEK